MLTGISKTTLAEKMQRVDAIDIAAKKNMTTKLTQLGHTSRKPRSARRRATILVLVMAVLGLLFVSGVAFMATMNFESSIISSERRHIQAAPAMNQVIEDTSMLLEELALPQNGLAGGGGMTGGAAAYVQLPGVHNLSAPIDPYFDQTTNRMYWPWVTDLEALQSQSFSGSKFKMGKQDDPLLVGDDQWFRLNVLSKPGYDVLVGQKGVGDSNGDGLAETPDEFDDNYRVLVDADGDGIVDAVEVDLSLAVGGNKRRLSGIARVLNPASKPSGTVKLGLRVVSHNGMVNVNASHPLLIGNVLGSLNSLFHPPYSPAVEEASLRRRHFLPPETLSLTQLQGSRFSADPITGDGHYAAELFPDRQTPRDHRYWPFSPQERGADPIIPLWWLRMDADLIDPSNPDPNDNEYDRRHLVTTVSYSDLIRRPAIVSQANVSKDLIDRIIEDFPNDAATRFPLIAYPYSDTAEIAITAACISDPDCTLNPRKGRLKLSLEWLDQASDTMSPSYTPLVDRILLIQDAFTLLLLNARGSAWGKYESADPTDLMEENTVWKPNYGAISLTAASLTANMIDFSDVDDTPTAVALRTADPNDPNSPGDPNPKFGMPTGEEVFGIEAQPFITEVVADVDDQDDTNPTDGKIDSTEYPIGTNSFYGIELYNPFANPINLDDYSVVVAGVTTRFAPGDTLAPGQFKGFYTNGGLLPTGAGATAQFDATGGSDTFLFQEGDTIALVLQTLGTTGLANVVVDRFVTGDGVGKLNSGLLALKRVANADPIEKWYAPVPLDTTNLISGNDTFGSPNFGASEGAPVELIFPDMPDDSLSTAFPTTGMMLMLMRHANSSTRAFTEALNNNLAELDISGSTPVDNGRMPIYDEQAPNNVDGIHAHHIDPNWDLTKMDTSGTIPAVGIQGTAGQAGGAMHLPWGQLVFDFFTAIPLDGPGPYTPDSNGSSNLVINEDAAPKVDMGGLRVHGQIDLNTAPWKVLEGLPFMTMDLMPAPFNATFSTALGLDVAQSALPSQIGEGLAKAIVAYRELRVLGTTAPDITGDYSTPGISVSRGWSDMAPAMRRGTGFMSIGELANVRHLGATVEYRTDSGVFDKDIDIRSYVDSIAVLASLGDWLTLRPHVFTVYGTLRGETDQTINDPSKPGATIDMQVRDVDSRALRFQETVDRLPTILGEPVRTIGQPVIGKYHDTRGD